MKLEQQVCSLELAKRLKELGVKQESLFWWFREGHHFAGNVEVPVGQATLTNDQPPYDFPFEDVASAFTVAELGEMLPQGITSGKGNDFVFCQALKGWAGKFMPSTRMWEVTQSLTEADARAKMLIYLIENTLITLSA